MTTWIQVLLLLLLMLLLSRSCWHEVLKLVMHWRLWQWSCIVW